MFLPEPETGDGPVELCAGLGLPRHRVPRVVGSHRVAEDRRSLLPSGGASGRASLEVAHTVWSHLHAAAAQSRPPVPLGVNIEEVSAHNFDLAVQMAREFPSWRGSAATRESTSDIAPEPGNTGRTRGSR